MVSSELAELMMDCKSKETYARWIRKYKNYREENQTDLQAFIVFMDWMKTCQMPIKFQEIIFKSFMKHISKSYKLVKSATLSLDNVYDYIQLENESFDEFLTVKVAMTLGVCGALLASESCAFEDIEYQQELININIRLSKTDQSSSGHFFSYLRTQIKINVFVN